MFLAALLQTERFSVPAKIRNMSSTGALVETATVPEPGSAVRLVRGCLAVPAHVVWASKGRCGLRFSSFVSVQHWLAAPANAEQRRIDDVVQLIKAGAIPLPVGGEPNPHVTSQQLGFDLKAACRLLDAHCDDVMNDESAIARYGERLQNLDIALQTIAVVADLLVGGSDERSTASRLENLRVSSRQAIEQTS